MKRTLLQMSAGGSMAPAVVRGALKLQDVVFSYPSRPSVNVLSGLTLNIEHGQVVALVGPSGGGALATRPVSHAALVES